MRGDPPIADSRCPPALPIRLADAWAAKPSEFTVYPGCACGKIPYKSCIQNEGYPPAGTEFGTWLDTESAAPRADVGQVSVMNCILDSVVPQ
jgi:hypothetical protein